MSRPRQDAVAALEREYADHLSDWDRDFIVRTVLAAFREPTAATLVIFLDELGELQGGWPDPCADWQGSPEMLTRRLDAREARMRLTWAWRRAIDRLASQHEPTGGRREVGRVSPPG